MNQISRNVINTRYARRSDAAKILEFLKELAEYENLVDCVYATEKDISDILFEKQQAEALIAELNGQAVGYALYFYNYSTFMAKRGIYLEDLYIQPHARGLGLGKELIKAVAKIAIDNGCGKMEWSCLNWNTPSIEFYKGLGAKPVEGWTIYRLDRQKLDQLVQNS